MKKFIYVVAMLAMGTTSVNAQTTYDFTQVATDNAVHAVKYGNGEDSDSEWALSVFSVKDDADVAMVYLVDENGNDYDKRFAIQNRKDAWRFRNTTDGVWRGLWAQYDRYIAILNLNPGDEITLVMSPDDQNRGLKFDVPDYDDAEKGYYQCITRAEYNDIVAAKMEAAGVTTETVTEDQLAQFREEAKTTQFKIWDDAETVGFNGTLLLKSEGGQYIEKITIKSSGDPTGINSVESQKADGQWYNLNGVKVIAPSKGVYIRDGKKMVLK